MTSAPFLSMRSGLAISGRTPRALYLMLRGYYDGSGKREDAVMTLTGLVASESVWEKFEQQWQEVLDRHSAPVLHMTDAMALRQNFSRNKGWTAEKVNALLVDLWRILASFRATSRFEDGATQGNLIALSCSVVMNGYYRAKTEIPNLREPEAICVNYCFQLPEDIEEPGEKHPKIAMVFDRKEYFQKQIGRVWEQMKAKNSENWSQQVQNIVNRDRELIEVGTANICPLQAADMVAWTVNNQHKNQNRSPLCNISSILCLTHYVKKYDYDAIMERYQNG